MDFVTTIAVTVCYGGLVLLPLALKEFPFPEALPTL
jgi:hypothetical protein